MGEARDERDDEGPSLIEQVRRRRLRVPDRMLPALRIALFVAIALLAVVTIVTTLLGRQARREALGLGDTVARLSMARENDRAAAVLFARPVLAGELAAIAAHLPPDTKLALATRAPDGALKVAIDAADPDTLRTTLKAEPFFSAFHERAQAVGEEGQIRVTFERLAQDAPEDGQ